MQSHVCECKHRYAMHRLMGAECYTLYCGCKIFHEKPNETPLLPPSEEVLLNRRKQREEIYRASREEKQEAF